MLGIKNIFLINTTLIIDNITIDFILTKFLNGYRRYVLYKLDEDFDFGYVPTIANNSRSGSMKYVYFDK